MTAHPQHTARAGRPGEDPGPDRDANREAALDAIYDRRFFEQYGARSPAYAAACAFIARELARRLAPRTAVDWGCGAGLHAAELLRLGVDVIAVDGARVDPDLCAPGVERRIADLARPIPDGLVPAGYDLSLCIDVMEHIAESDAGAALANVTRGAARVVLSCAPPGQGGHHHVNEQPRRYWVQRMAALGWRYDRAATGAMERWFLAHRDVLPWSWMYHNLCIYDRAGGARGRPERAHATRETREDVR